MRKIIPVIMSLALLLSLLAPASLAQAAAQSNNNAQQPAAAPPPPPNSDQSGTQQMAPPPCQNSDGTVQPPPGGWPDGQQIPPPPPPPPDNQYNYYNDYGWYDFYQDDYIYYESYGVSESLRQRAADRAGDLLEYGEDYGCDIDFRTIENNNSRYIIALYFERHNRSLTIRQIARNGKIKYTHNGKKIKKKAVKRLIRNLG